MKFHRCKILCIKQIDYTQYFYNSIDGFSKWEVGCLQLLPLLQKESCVLVKQYRIYIFIIRLIDMFYELTTRK